MTAFTPPVLSEATAAFCFLSILLIPCALAGLAVITAGLGRSRNVAHTLLSALCIVATASITYFAFGFAWQGYTGRPDHVFVLGGRAWGWAGAERFLLRGIEFERSPYCLALLFGLFAVGLAAMIPLGAAAERWRLGASCASTVILSGFIYPLYANWVWGGGWLAQLGAAYQLERGLIDSGGASTIQAVGGLTALALAWILGPRRGKFDSQGTPAALPAHNAVMVLFGCFLALIGYIGLDCAGAILFTGIEPGRAILIVVNAVLAAASAVLAAAGVTRYRFGKADASLCANAWIAGLVACSAGCAVIRPSGAVLVGLVAGPLVVFSVGWLEFHSKIDDPGGAISVHAFGGLWGMLAVGLLAESPFNGQDQWLAQVIGIATLIGFVLPLAYGSNWLLDKVIRQRVTPEGERQGLDLYELGTGAYPDFKIDED